MDVIKIGQFIKSLRKERALTQKEVAEQLNVSEKTVSKWETGRGFPEMSLLLPLCKYFGIGINELLSGERLTDERYVEKAEENISSLMIDRTSPKKKVVITTVSCVLTLLACLAINVLSAYFIPQVWLKLVLLGISLVMVCAVVAVIVVVAVSVEIYECKECGEKFVPTLSAYALAPHTMTRRYLKCPFCGKRCWNKIRIRK